MGFEMSRLGYHVSHEQFSPSDLLGFIQHAEAAGFQCAMSSDHFKPWASAQGQSGSAWPWLGAALQSTSLPFGIISAPGYRYHPAILAQNAATLSAMFPHRLWLALGSGQRLNEDITGLPWPVKSERNAGLRECADIVRALMSGETVTHRGRVEVVDARLYSLPATPPRLIGAAVTEATAEFVGGWADGLLTVGSAPEQIAKVIAAFRRGGGEGKPVYLQAKLGWDASEEEALYGAFEQWRYNILGGDVAWELRSPEQFEAATIHVRPEDMRGSVFITSDPGRVSGWIDDLAHLGIDEILVHQVGRNQLAFIEMMAARVLRAV
jgi:probable non-F420 flavinoid oxidoreductase